MGQHCVNLLDEERSKFEVLFTNHIKMSLVIGKTNPHILVYNAFIYKRFEMLPSKDSLSSRSDIIRKAAYV